MRKEAEAEKRRKEKACLTAPSRQGDRETGNSFAEIGLGICDLGFGTWSLGFFSFSGSWRTWRFDLPRPREKRLRKEIEVEKGRKGKRRKETACLTAPSRQGDRGHSRILAKASYCDFG